MLKENKVKNKYYNQRAIVILGESLNKIYLIPTHIISTISQIVSSLGRLIKQKND